MFRNKKGAADGSSVAVIIILIALFMVLYILFVPPDVRRDLLEGTNLSGGASVDKAADKRELIAESPGTVFPVKSAVSLHKLPNMNLFLKTEPKIVNLSSSLVIKKGLFSDSSPVLRFSLASLADTNKVNLVFSVSKSSGELRIKVNGNTFYAEEIGSPGIKVVEVPTSYLQKNNELEFSVSTKVFGSNVYSLQDVSVKQEFELRNAEETRTFSLSEREKNSMESAVISFRQFCNERLESGLADFRVNVNGREAFRKKISCLNTDESFEIKKSLFLEGTNSISFVIEEGDFLFTDVELRVKSKESEFPSYTFALTPENFDDIEDGGRKLTLSLFLENNKENKNARLEINSNEFLMRTDSDKFELNLRDYVVDGTNFLRIVPSNTFSIVGLKVVLE